MITYPIFSLPLPPLSLPPSLTATLSSPPHLPALPDHCQSSDSGWANWGIDGELQIFDVESVDGFVLHFGFVHRGTLSVGDRIHLKVDSKTKRPISDAEPLFIFPLLIAVIRSSIFQIDENKRTATSRSHTAAHLLNFGLDQIFPETISENGASRVCTIEPDTLIMEFGTTTNVTDSETTKMENLVNLMMYHQVFEISEKSPTEALEILSFKIAKCQLI